MFNFNSICSKTLFPLCSLIAAVSPEDDFQRGVVPLCYARSVELANTMIFQIGNAFVHIGTILILLVIIFNVRVKYTAIGRSEMLFSMYLLLALCVSSLIVDCGVSPPSSDSYAYFAAVQIGLASSVCMSLLYNSIICFQFWEDGTRKSMLGTYSIAGAWGIVTFLVSIITFKGWGTALNDKHQLVLFIVCYVVNAVILAAFYVSLVIMVIFALGSYWALGAILLALTFFVVGQILAYVVSNTICVGTSHYTDGLLFASVSNIFAVMMIYKFWDMITTDDLEFSVANVEQGVKAFSNDEEKRRSQMF